VGSEMCIRDSPGRPPESANSKPTAMIHLRGVAIDSYLDRHSAIAAEIIQSSWPAARTITKIKPRPERRTISQRVNQKMRSAQCG